MEPLTVPSGATVSWNGMPVQQAPWMGLGGPGVYVEAENGYGGRVAYGLRSAARAA